MILTPNSPGRGTRSVEEKENSRWRFAISVLLWMLVMLGGTKTVTAQNQVMGELDFEGKTKVERDSGVWIDGNYVGYLKELNGTKKIMLLPGSHEVTVRQSGYMDFVQKVVVEPGELPKVPELLNCGAAPPSELSKVWVPGPCTLTVPPSKLLNTAPLPAWIFAPFAHVTVKLLFTV